MDVWSTTVPSGYLIGILSKALPSPTLPSLLPLHQEFCPEEGIWWSLQLYDCLDCKTARPRRFAWPKSHAACKTDLRKEEATVLQSNNCCSHLATNVLSSVFPHMYKSVQTGRLTQLKTAVTPPWASFFSTIGCCDNCRHEHRLCVAMRALIPFFFFHFLFLQENLVDK